MRVIKVFDISAEDIVRAHITEHQHASKDEPVPPAITDAYFRYLEKLDDLNVTESAAQTAIETGQEELIQDDDLSSDQKANIKDFLQHLGEVVELTRTERVKTQQDYDRLADKVFELETESITYSTIYSSVP
ncbi:hypothetical protein K5D56_26285 [Pseudomonas cichorii]|nr:hypothetical protein [Pseudomonas cichorii]